MVHPLIVAEAVSLGSAGVGYTAYLVSKKLLKKKLKRKVKDKRKYRRHLAIGEPRDAFFITEKWFEEAGEFIGMKPEKNPQLKLTKKIARKLHAQQSGMRKFYRTYKKMGKVNHVPPLIERPTKQIKRILEIKD